MTNFVFNIAKGRVAHYGTLPAGNDALIVVPIATSNAEIDLGLVKRTSLADILTVSSEQTTLGRKVLDDVSTNIESVSNTVNVTASEFVFEAASGPPISGLVICYAPNVDTSPDSSIIPLLKFDFSAIPNGNDIPIQFSPSGLYVATYPEGQGF